MTTEIMPGQSTEIKSYDSLLQDSLQAKYPTEFLNTLSISGLPPHNLKFKKNLPIMLTKNINPNCRLCNGTRLKVSNIFSRLIEAKIDFGNIFYSNM